MKKVLLMLISVISLLAASCGADATKPKDLKEPGTETVSGTAYYYITGQSQNTAIYVDTFGFDPTASSGTQKPVLVTDAKIVQRDANGNETTVASTLDKGNTGSYVYSITPTANPASGNTAYVVYNYKQMTGDGTYVKCDSVTVNTSTSAGIGITTIDVSNPAFKKGGLVKEVKYSYTSNGIDEMGTILLTKRITEDGVFTLTSNDLASIAYIPNGNVTFIIEAYVF